MAITWQLVIKKIQFFSTLIFHKCQINFTTVNLSRNVIVTYSYSGEELHISVIFFHLLVYY